MAIGTKAAPPPPAPSSGFAWGEWTGWAGLAALEIYFLAVSWRKWPDPLFDFGRELYIPWRLSHGAVLYRDADDFFGPLSQYFNAGLFALFGPGLTVLVAANLAVFAAILVIIYVLFRHAWGKTAALAAAGIFISVFGFGQYVDVGNYNYATPYAHEATHGLLACLLLVLALFRWMEQPTLLSSGVAGGLFGLTAVLKPEIMIPAALVTAAAVTMTWISRQAAPFRAAAVWAVASALPTLGFAAYFSAYMPWGAAFSLASRVWLTVGVARYTHDSIQRGFFGFNEIWPNLSAHVIASVLAVVVIAGIAGLAWLIHRSAGMMTRVFLAAALAGGAAWVGFFDVNWSYVGRCVLGLVAAYILMCGLAALRQSKRGGIDRLLQRRLILALLAASLMLRMILNGRIYHYGFYQAALAAVLIPAVMIGEMPSWLGLGQWGRAAVIAGTLFLVTPGVILLAAQSHDYLSLKSYPLGAGRDRFYTYPPNLDARTGIIQAFLQRLERAPRGQTLLVLPEGEMMNYLARMPSPVAPYLFYSAATSHGHEAVIVSDLRSRPPDYVMIISRDLREYGISRYGETQDKGREILAWVAENYETEMSIGDDPLDPDKAGGVLLRRKASAPGPASQGGGH